MFLDVEFVARSEIIGTYRLATRFLTRAVRHLKSDFEVIFLNLEINYLTSLQGRMSILPRHF
jgi:hypothetical protein